jgi:hypothetical protein
MCGRSSAYVSRMRCSSLPLFDQELSSCLLFVVAHPFPCSCSAFSHVYYPLLSLCYHTSS